MRTVDIAGYEGVYSISENGVVTSLKRESVINSVNRGTYTRVVPEVVMKPRITNSYWSVCLWDGNEFATKSIHRLIAIAFIDGFQPGLQVNHKNGNKLDNSLSNLEWVTPSENISHTFRELGRIGPRGTINGLSKLKDEDIPKIRALIGTKSLAKIASDFGVTSSAIFKIKQNTGWSHVK